MNTAALPSSSHIHAERSSLVNRRDIPLRQQGGTVMLCLAGTATIKINLNEYRIRQGCEIILIPDSIFVLASASDDFMADVVTFTEPVFKEVIFKLDPNFISHLWHQPIHQHSAETFKVACSIYGLIFSACSDTQNSYRENIAINYLRNIFLISYDAIQRNALPQRQQLLTRREEQLHRFLRLVDAKAGKHRDVAYYAEALCVSKSYLTAITRSIISKSPKEVIDERIVQEIKILLDHSDCSVQQIADLLHFPDQSYLGRFFKHHTGKSPLAYRSSIKAHNF